MDLIRLPVGEQVNVDKDCIRLDELEDGSYRLTGTALCTREDKGTSVSLVDALTFATRDEAEQIGIAWAESVGVARLHLSVSTVGRPLKLMEIDLPG